MSKGYGAIQRRVLAKLAENTADPLEDERATLSYRTEANTRSWTPLSDLAVDGTHSAIESARRALYRLAEDGVVALASRSTLTADGVTRHVSIARLTNPELDAAVEAVRIEVREAHNARVRANGAERKSHVEVREADRRAEFHAHQEALRVARNARRNTARARQGKTA